MLIQTHAKWHKFSEKEPMPTGISSGRKFQRAQNFKEENFKELILLDLKILLGADIPWQRSGKQQELSVAALSKAGADDDKSASDDDKSASGDEPPARGRCSCSSCRFW